MRGSFPKSLLLALLAAGCSSAPRRPAPKRAGTRSVALDSRAQRLLDAAGTSSPSSAGRPAAAPRPAPLEAGRVSDSIIQIGIVRQADRLVLRPDGRFSAVDQKNGETVELEPGRDYVLAASGRRLTLGGYEFEGQFRLIPARPENALLVGAKKYRGSLLVRSSGPSTFTIVNEVGLEDYIEGVLPAEMSPDWPAEALKAQAVVARTFALANLDKFRAQGFDLSDDNRSQAYADVDRQKASTRLAVQQTQGQVLTWDGKVLHAFFHSCCGGHTTSIGTIWGSMTAAPKPLRGVADRYCALSPEYKWSAYFATDDIVAALQKHGFPISKVQAVRVGQYDFSSGYMKTIKVKANRKWIEIRANDFRNWIGNRDFKSTKVIRIVPKSRGFYFFGRGYGHGVGLCQWGAKAMAERGKDYKKILNFYFPGAKLETRDD